MPSTVTMAPVKDHMVVLKGGLDQLTPSLMLQPGAARDAVNFEVEPTGGYARVGGYERVDGHASPSAASYVLIQLTSFVTVPSVGQTLTGQTSGATGVIIAYADTYVVVTLVTGVFTDTEVMKVSTTTIGTATPLTQTLSTRTSAQYLALAANVYRTLIGAVPGSGPIRGVVSAVFGGVHTIYAFRNNAGGTAVALYKSSASGWTLVPFYYEISFTAGAASVPVDGATLTQGANTATIHRVMLQTGAWTGAGTGRLIISAPTPGSFTAGAATISGGATCTLSGAETAITMSPGGTFEFDVANFAGSSTTRRIYGADGTNRCFEFDGTILAPIYTGFNPDAPKYIRYHKNHLFCSFGSSLGHSGVGTPFNWSAGAGASEIAVGDVITGIIPLPGSQESPALLVSTDRQLRILYGSAAGGTSPWNLITYTDGTGAKDRSLQNLEHTYLLGGQGVVNLQTAQDFGNFSFDTITANVQPFIADKRTKLVASSINRNRAQYRMFFSDGSGLYVTIVSGKYRGSMPVQFPNIVSRVWESSDANGNPVSYFGDTTGFVHQLDKGSSFDGANIDAYLILNWDNAKMPRVRKRYRRMSVEVYGNFYAEFSFGYELGYGRTEFDQPSPIVYPTNFAGGGARWDAVLWDAFSWDGLTLFPSELEMTGTAENFRSVWRTTGNFIYPFTLTTTLTHYSPRRRVR